MPSAWRDAKGPPSSRGIGRGTLQGLYSLASLAGIVLISIGYGQYRQAGYIPVWDPPVWTRHLALLLVWFAFVCFAAAYLPGRIKRTLKHPMLAGVKIWALAPSHGQRRSRARSCCSARSWPGPWRPASASSAGTRPCRTARRWSRPQASQRCACVAIGTVAYLAFVVWLHPSADRRSGSARERLTDQPRDAIIRPDLGRGLDRPHSSSQRRGLRRDQPLAFDGGVW